MQTLALEVTDDREEKKKCLPSAFCYPLSIQNTEEGKGRNSV